MMDSLEGKEKVLIITKTEKKNKKNSVIIYCLNNIQFLKLIPYVVKDIIM